MSQSYSRMGLLLATLMSGDQRRQNVRLQKQLHFELIEWDLFFPLEKLQSIRGEKNICTLKKDKTIIIRGLFSQIQ